MSAPSRAARELAAKLVIPEAVMQTAEIIQSAIKDLLEKAEAMANHWNSGNNSELRKALEPWKAGE